MKSKSMRESIRMLIFLPAHFYKHLTFSKSILLRPNSHLLFPDSGNNKLSYMRWVEKGTNTSISYNLYNRSILAPIALSLPSIFSYPLSIW